MLTAVMLMALFGVATGQCRETVEITCHSCVDDYIDDGGEQQVFLVRFGRLECVDHQYRYEIAENGGQYSSAANFMPLITDRTHCSQKRCETSILYQPPTTLPLTLGVSVIVKLDTVEFKSVSSQLYTQKSQLQPGTCYFTQEGTACHTIYEFFCEGFFEQIGRVRLLHEHSLEVYVEFVDFQLYEMRLFLPAGASV